MHIAFLVPAFLPGATAEQFRSYGFCQINQARGLMALGHRVTIIARAAETVEAEWDGIRCCFVRDDLPPVLRAWQSSGPLLRALRQTAPDVVHLHGLANPVLTLTLQRALPRDTPIFAEYHGDAVPRFPLNLLQRHVLRRLTGCIFTNHQKAEDWRTCASLSPDRIHHCIECAPDRTRCDRATARRETGITGAPVFLWNSRAVPRRNPDVVVATYARYIDATPGTTSQFYMMIPDHDPAVLQRIREVMAAAPQLDKHFTLILDRKPQAAMTAYYNSADYILSGSEDDPYGFGVVDAMSCGVIPVVPRSATFREITRDGEIGYLWDVTDPDTLLRTLIALPTEAEEIAKLSAQVQEHFCAHHSMAAQGRTLEAIYRSALPPRPTP